DLERFRREAETLAGLNLVGVAPVLDAGVDRGRHWIAMKWIEGRTLRDVRASLSDPNARLHDLRDRFRLVARLARTFAAVHRARVVHRDVKPSNIMLDHVGEPMIIDFGIAQVGGLPELTEQDDARLGTPRYLAPEVVADGNAAGGPSVDVYGLGLVLYELATEKDAFEGVGRGELYERIRRSGPTAPRAAKPSLSHDAEAVILRAIDVDPRRRYPDMDAFADDLERVARGEAPDRVTLARARPWVRFVRAQARRRGRLAAAALLAAAAVAAPFGWRAARFEIDARAAEARLAPFAWMPPDALLDGVGVPEDAVAHLAGAEQSPRRRLLAAWLRYAAGRYEEAAGALGAPRADESFGARLLRDHVEALLREAAAPGVVLRNDNIREEKGDRELEIPTPRGRPRDAAELVAAAREGADARDAVDHVVLAGLAWSVVPLASKEGREPARSLARASAESAATDDDVRPAAAYILAALDVVDGALAAARTRLDAVVAARPEALGAALLRAHVSCESGDPIAGRAELEAIAAAIPESHRAWPRLQHRLARLYADCGRAAEAEAVAARWCGSAAWPQELHRALPWATLAECATDPAERVRRWEQAVDGWALWRPAWEALARAQQAAGRVDGLASPDVGEGTVAIPASVEDWLRLELFGLRPLDRNLGAVVSVVLDHSDR
ncbi:MAG TPA: serine/threonine-protein kinase, partial [Planctomycetota bacterium]|nr:serine/threonine-protein kinase [Planctomycetota bacterium]